jgi:hypothetical protein
MSLWDHYLQYGALPDDCPLYDLHGHWGPFYGIHLPASDERGSAPRTGAGEACVLHHPVSLPRTSKRGEYRNGQGF